MNPMQDVTSLKKYFIANLQMASSNPPISMNAIAKCISARGPQRPPAQMHGTVSLDRALLGEGVVLTDCTVRNSVIGNCVYVGRGSLVEDSVLLGSPEPTNQRAWEAARAAGRQVYGVGEDCILRGCIVDENASIGNCVRILNAAGVQEADRADIDGYMIQDGIVVVMRDAVIPDGTII
jgi:glucose-1-phosphate adenylyltransferase